MKCSRGRGQRGFTVHEMLLVVAILIVLLAVSIVGLVSYTRKLHLAELDNSAREIFLAAQNRAILLSGGQRLEGLVVKSGDANRIDHVEVLPGAEETTQISVYYIHCSDDDIEELLPAASIDPTLWDGDFYITYEPESGSIVDVFYAEEPLPVEEEGGFPAFYTTWRGASKEQRMDSDPMIGYYGGETAESGTAISLRTPVINIENSDTLKVQVTYWLPRSLAMTAEANNVTLDVDLTYGEHTVTLLQSNDNREQESSVAYIAYTYTWTLDTLNETKFRDLFPAGTAVDCGADFTITAEVSYSGTLDVNGARKTATDNSLFATGSGEETAYISCLRHLQNLDVTHSSVTGKTAAVQKNDILEIANYVFDPIENEELLSYDGQEYTIENVTISATEAAGLFGSFGSGEDGSKTLTGIRLVNTTVTGHSDPVGVLVGQGDHLTLSNCQVYWENQSDEYTNLRYLLGDSASGLKYPVTGSSYAGGLAGVLTNSTIQNCSASTLVSANTVGGLVGQGSDLTVIGSYAASYLRGSNTAGLVGNLTTASSIDSSYAVGYLATDNGGNAAGLCLGNGSATVSRSYSAMLFVADRNNRPLCATGTYDSYTHYLDSELFGFGAGDKDHAASYDQLVSPALWDRLFGTGTFTSKTTTQSHPYNLQTTLTLTNYTYPGLEELDHWGDWGAQFQNGSLVYFEKYKDGSYGFSGGGVNHLRDEMVTLDGYAMAYTGTESTSGIDITLSIQYQTSANQDDETTKRYTKDAMYVVEDVANAAGREEDYYLLPLPEDIVNSDYSAVNFYQKITVTNDTDETEKSYYYNPHFADAILPYDANTNLSQLAAQLRVSVRSPRHLYNLSRFSVYYASTHQYRFLQQLDLDYTKYEGYNLFTGDWTQSPIGISAAQPFRSSYYGNCHTISGVVATAGTHQYVGLFGYTTGVVQDVVYNMTKPMTISRTGSSTTVYAGGLIGYNGGTVDNCAVYSVDLEVQCFEYSTAYLGGLAGINAGVIRDSAAEVADLAANASFSNAYAGGFVGHNASGGTIDRCYAVGSVSSARARYGTVYACGFAGRNSATVSRSYAAVRLTVSGDAVSYGFCHDSTTNCVYLNDGNFTYRNEHYAAQYTDSYAKAVTWAQLTGADQAASVTNLGMSKAAGEYPYPTAVIKKLDETGEQFQYVHYGQWPDAMELGTMGVYYWEKLDIGGAVSYHISAISQVDGQTVERSTLSTAHGDGGVVTEYGYGYFHTPGVTVTTASSGIGYSDSTDFFFDSSLENTKANEALSHLMGGRYTFHSFNTWGTAQEKQGLYPLSEEGSIQPPNGTWTLGNTFTVYLNPFFANALSSKKETLPGTKDNPYEVRSIEQLQFINWNKNAKSTVRPMDIYNKDKFPYLCYGSYGNWTLCPYYWEQTHDLEGKSGVTYTPIAAVYDETSNSTGDLFGWFGGTYDGNDYLINEVNIKGPDGGSSCVGLFGAVFNGTLKNIVLYSESGKATVEGNNSNLSRWYAIGGLAGLAGSNSGSAVVNCTVAGYTIKDTHKSTSQGGWGGTGLGGLIGVSDMSLEGCTAVTNVVLDSVSNDHVRVGGLVGSCQNTISSCYTGGTITITNTANATDQWINGYLYTKKIYVGGIVGGIYLKPQTVGGKSGVTVGHSGNYLQNTLRNCYTYIELPAISSNGDIAGLYAVGGSGELNRYYAGINDGNADHGYTNYENSYYLQSVVLQNSSTQEINSKRNDLQWVKPLTFAEMADTKTENGLLWKLNNLTGYKGGFSTVTTETATGEPLSGRYSFANDPSLLGTDYPFPTILTQTSDVVQGGIANVHYGDWPIEGIRRDDGALPVNLDLFANYKEADQGALWRETLQLSAVSASGQWKAESQNKAVATAAIDQGGNLTITAQSAGSTIVTVTYGSYSLDIEVNVTANLRLTTDNNAAVTAFTDATVSTPLQLADQNGSALPDSLQQKIELSALSVEFDPDYFTIATLSNEQDTGLRLTADGKTIAGSTQMTASYTFAYLGTEYPSTAVLSLNVVEPVIEVKPVTFVFDGEPEKTTMYTGTEDGQFVLKLKADGEAQTLQALQLTAYEEVATEYKDVAWVQWAKDGGGTEQVGTLSITAYSQPLYPAAATVRVQYQFQYGGSTYTLWQDLPIELMEPQTEGPTTPPEGSAEGEVQP